MRASERARARGREGGREKRKRRKSKKDGQEEAKEEGRGSKGGRGAQTERRRKEEKRREEEGAKHHATSPFPSKSGLRPKVLPAGCVCEEDPAGSVARRRVSASELRLTVPARSAGPALCNGRRAEARARRRAPPRNLAGDDGPMDNGVIDGPPIPRSSASKFRRATYEKTLSEYLPPEGPIGAGQCWDNAIGDTWILYENAPLSAQLTAAPEARGKKRAR